jgi:MoaA/NifB/PqqE/SkfB family radical SAM enzyme
VEAIKIIENVIMLKIEQSKFTKRAVLYIGFKCNLRCRFCYYADNVTVPKEWYSLDCCKRDAHTFRSVYKNKFVDITGGEPTIYPDILQLVSYCREIGLRPTIITNMQALADLDVAKQFKDAGIEDFLCSVHNLGVAYDDVVGVNGSFSRVEKALDNLVHLSIPFRTNVTINKTNFKALKNIAEFVYTKGCRTINYISCNLFRDHDETFDLIARFSEMKDCLHEALNYCDIHSMHTAVRYMPFCFLYGHENKCYNYRQLPYDNYEWDYKSWSDVNSSAPAPKVSRGLYNFMEDSGAYEHLAKVFTGESYTYSPKCMDCRLSLICDGLNKNYARKFGTEEVCPCPGDKITKPDEFLAK